MQNVWNRSILPSNRSGYKGATFNKKSGKWQGRIKANGKLYGLGYFQTPQEAHEAYKTAAIKLHGEFSRF
jgi:hypothetical protein